MIPMDASARSAAEIIEVARLGEAAQRLAAPAMTGRVLFERLCESALYTDALKVLPHLLSKRGAVWWGCLCAWETERSFLGLAGEAALRSAVQWVLAPCEETRRLANETAAGAGGLETVSGCLAQAAAWSDGSMTPPELPVVPPPPHLTAAVVAGAVLLAASRHALFHWNEIQQHFLELGREVARGRLRWQGGERGRARLQPRRKKRIRKAAVLAGAGAEGLP